MTDSSAEDRMSGVEETPPAAGEEREPNPAPEAAGPKTLRMWRRRFSCAAL